MDPRDFLAQARRLANAGGAAGNRSAISRAYYAAFNVGCEHCSNWEVNLSEGSDAHGLLRQLLQTSREPRLTRLSGVLRELRMLRNKADYRLREEHPEGEKAARKALGLAQDVISALDCFAALPESERAPAIRRIRGATQGSPGRFGDARD